MQHGIAAESFKSYIIQGLKDAKQISKSFLVTHNSGAYNPVSMSRSIMRTLPHNIFTILKVVDAKWNQIISQIIKSFTSAGNFPRLLELEESTPEHLSVADPDYLFRLLPYWFFFSFLNVH